MYVTAHRVRAADRREAIHSFLHRHGAIAWPRVVASWPEDNPGELVDRQTSLPVGGNVVRSYLDLLAPDGRDPEALARALAELAGQVSTGENPTVARLGDVTLRFGVEGDLLSRRAEEYEELAREALALLRRNSG